jgi:hypothetical protein
MNNELRRSELISLAENAEKRFLTLSESATNTAEKESYLRSAEHSARLAEKYRNIDSATISVGSFLKSSERQSLASERITRHTSLMAQQWVDLELSESLVEKSRGRGHPWTEEDVKSVLEANNFPYQLDDYQHLVEQFERYRA